MERLEIRRVVICTVVWKNPPTGCRKTRNTKSSRKSRTMLDFFFQAEDGIRDIGVTGVQTCALPICATWRFTTITHQLPRMPSSARGSTNGESSTTARVSIGRGSLIASNRSAGPQANSRSEERRVGEEGRPRGAADYYKKKTSTHHVC